MSSQAAETAENLLPSYLCSTVAAETVLDILELLPTGTLHSLATLTGCRRLHSLASSVLWRQRDIFDWIDLKLLVDALERSPSRHIYATAIKHATLSLPKLVKEQCPLGMEPLELVTAFFSKSMLRMSSLC